MTLTSITAFTESTQNVTADPTMVAEVGTYGRNEGFKLPKYPKQLPPPSTGLNMA